jgi:hypothetical protein
MNTTIRRRLALTAMDLEDEVLRRLGATPNV